MVDGKKSSSTLQRLARWHSSANSKTIVSTDKNGSAVDKSLFQALDHDDLKQGSLYIVKIHHVSVCLFEGWDDDMCCFSVLRSEAVPMRWSEARYLPGDFHAYDAFDDDGNPPVHLWTRFLRVSVPTNWFAMFEEARRKQREWCGHHPQLYEEASSRRISAIANHYVNVSSIPPPSTAAASTNIVDPVFSPQISIQSSISTLPMDSRPLGLFGNQSFDEVARTTALMDRNELRKHLQNDLEHATITTTTSTTPSTQPSTLEQQQQQRKSLSAVNLDEKITLNRHSSYSPKIKTRESYQSFTWSEGRAS